MENPSDEKISLRPFLESINQYCSSLSKENLINFLLSYAQTIPARERVVFLDNIFSFANSKNIPQWDETLLDKISDLKDRVQERRDSIEDGSFYDDYEYNRTGWDYDDDDPDFFSDEQIEEMDAFFGEADALFLAGKLREAQNVYKTLYDILNGEGHLRGANEYFVHIEQRETKARYCRCVYETSDPAERAKNLLAVMDIDAPLSSYSFDIDEAQHPLLADVRDAGTDFLPEEKEFWNDWITILSEYDTDRAHILFMEAIYLKDGMDGVQKLARKWEEKQPRGYLFWIKLIKSEEERGKIIEIVREALSVLPYSPLRSVIASEMIEAGENTQDSRAILDGKRELFYSVPDEDNLIGLLREAKKQNVYEIENILLHLRDRNAESTHKKEVQILLMKGDLSGAFIKAKDSDSLGWSYQRGGAGAVLFAGILSALVITHIEEAEVIKQILKRYTESIGADSFMKDEHAVADLFLFHEILGSLEMTSMTDGEKKSYIHWVEERGRKRIEDIVSNKHRKSYSKAAEILVGLAECFILLGYEERGRGLLCEYRDKRYNRFYAFKGELNKILSISKIFLKNQ